MPYKKNGEWEEDWHWGETENSSARRGKEFFDRYLKDRDVLDIGSGGQPITEDATCYDRQINEEHDATYMKEIANETFDVVYASHVLEDINVPYLAIRNWWRILKQNGYLIIAVPDRDLYEGKKELPSLYNPDHRMFFLDDREELPYTINLSSLIRSCLIDKSYEIEYMEVCGDNIMDELPEWLQAVEGHPIPEYQIEIVIRKIL